MASEDLEYSAEVVQAESFHGAFFHLRLVALVPIHFRYMEKIILPKLTFPVLQMIQRMK